MRGGHGRRQQSGNHRSGLGHIFDEDRRGHGPAAPFVAIGGAILDLIGAISAHHEAAVANEQTILCQAVPATMPP